MAVLRHRTQREWRRLTCFSYLSGGEGRVHPSPQPAGQRGEEEDPFGAGERGAEGATAGPGGGQTGPAAGDRQGGITEPLNRLHKGPGLGLSGQLTGSNSALKQGC